MNPWNLTVEPVARKIIFLAAISALTTSKTAGIIWLARNLCQISR